LCVTYVASLDDSTYAQALSQVGSLNLFSSVPINKKHIFAGLY